MLVSRWSTQSRTASCMAASSPVVAPPQPGPSSKKRSTDATCLQPLAFMTAANMMNYSGPHRLALEEASQRSLHISFVQPASRLQQHNGTEQQAGELQCATQQLDACVTSADSHAECASSMIPCVRSSASCDAFNSKYQVIRLASRQLAGLVDTVLSRQLLLHACQSPGG